MENRSVVGDPGQPLAASVGRNLRTLREGRRYSLGRLAERAAMSKGTLSKLEAGEGNPTLETLAALAAALAVEVGELLAVTSPQVAVVRAGEGLKLDDTALPARLVNGFSGDGLRTEVHELEVPAGHREVSATHGAGSWEHAIVTSGTVELGPLESTARLGPGDYAVYPADGPHVWRGVGRSTARVWVFLAVADLSSSR